MKTNSGYPNIDAERVRNRMTVLELANALGISRKTYYNWCRSGRIPQCKLIQMADLFDVTVDYLLGIQDNMA